MQPTEIRGFATEAERLRVETVVQTLTRMRNRGGTVAEIAHDTRNVVTALGLYCDLLDEPGVLTDQYRHYASELRLLAAASRRLVEKLVMLDERDTSWLREIPDLHDTRDLRGTPDLDRTDAMEPAPRPMRTSASQSDGPDLNRPIQNLQDDLLANRNLLDAMAGLAIAVTVRTEGGARPVRLTSEDLTRVLVNLVKNAAEAMRRAGQIEIALRERPDENGNPEALLLSVEDTGPGIPVQLREKIFEPGFTTHATGADAGGDGGWPAMHRGLGLAITRSVIETAGGRVSASNRAEGGSRIEIELPVRKTGIRD